MANLADIAREVGVSISTVSRVLNNNAPISQEIRTQVLEVAQRLGYHRHLTNDGANENESTVGIVFPDMMSDYYAHVLQTLMERFHTKNMNALIASTDFDPEAAIHAVRRMRQCRVKCLLVIVDDCEGVSRQLISEVHASGLPTAFITATYIDNMDFDCLYVDERRGNMMAVEHLMHRGYKRIGFVGEDKTANRRDMFLETMRQFNMPVFNEYVRLGSERAERGGYLRMKEILKLHQLPDAVCAGYDQIAIGAIHAIREAGLRIPQDIAVIGSNGIPATTYIEGGITTVTSPCEDMAAIAVRILLRRMEVPFSQPQQIAIKPILTVGATT